MKNLILNNGQIALYVGKDRWDRPHYFIEYNSKTYRVCCIELDGSYLHTLSPRNDPEGEPDFALSKDYQPKEDQSELNR